MARPSSSRIPTSNPSSSLAENPFDQLASLSLPSSPPTLHSSPKPSQSAAPSRPEKSRPRLEIRREKSGRGGKTVTTIEGVAHLGADAKKKILKDLKTRCGSGGTDRGNILEIQGDQRDLVSEYLFGIGFRPVAAGG
ncbi:MAG: translation initiation factor [Puniceicoccaceae bacterium]